MPFASEGSAASDAAAGEAASQSDDATVGDDTVEGSVAGSALVIGAVAAVAAAAANAARWVTVERLLRRVSDAIANDEVGSGGTSGAELPSNGSQGRHGCDLARSADTNADVDVDADADADADDGSASTSTGGIVWARRVGCSSGEAVWGDGAAGGDSETGETGESNDVVDRAEGAVSSAASEAETGAETGADFVGVVVSSSSAGVVTDASDIGVIGQSQDSSPLPQQHAGALHQDDVDDSLGDFASLDDAESLDLESLSGRLNFLAEGRGAAQSRDDDVAERSGLIRRGSAGASSAGDSSAGDSAPAPEQPRRRLDPLFVMAWTAPLCAVMTFIVALPVEGFAAAASPAWDAASTSVTAVLGTLAGALLAFVMIGAELQVISRASAITMTVAGHVKEALVIGLGAVVLGETVGVAEGVGIALVLAGTTAFGVLERGQGEQGSPAATGRSTSGRAGAGRAGAKAGDGSAGAAQAEAMAVAAGARAAANGLVDGAL